MIKDRLTKNYADNSLSVNIKKGLDWLNSIDLINIQDGKYYIESDNLYANVQTYETKRDANYEAHRKYIDIQYMIKGKEYVGVVSYERCKTVENYDSNRDIEFLTCNDKVEYQTLNEGEFLILYPDDAHKPSIMIDEPKKVKKVVVKVRI